MDTIITILFVVLILKLVFEILPDLIGFAFSLFFGFIGIILFICLLPFLGIFFFAGDAIVLLLLLLLIRKR